MKPDTICIQGGWKPKNGEPRQLPIYQSTTWLPRDHLTDIENPPPVTTSSPPLAESTKYPSSFAGV